jgi:hypothetical protein
MKTTTIIFALLFISCSSQPGLNQYLNTMDLSLVDNCEIISSESSAAVGDMSASYKFKVSDRDYESILRKITSIEHFNDERMSHNNSGKYAYMRDGKYGYEMVKDDNNGVERYCILIDKDKTIVLTYIQE